MVNIFVVFIVETRETLKSTCPHLNNFVRQIYKMKHSFVIFLYKWKICYLLEIFIGLRAIEF